jgi:vacuolar-type H+-ATPase subunit C/Vma6
LDRSGGGHAYANGRIRALEETFISRRMWQMLISARDREELLKLLSDTWYGDHLSDHEHDLDAALESAQTETEDELSDLSENPALVAGLLHRRDVRNARYIWKQALLEDETEGEDSSPPVERDGLIPISVLRTALTEPDALEELPGPFGSTLERLLTEGGRGLTVLEADQIMDRLAAQIELRELPRFGRSLEAFVRTRIELVNFQTAGRCKPSGMPRSELEEMLVDGGYHTPSEIGEAYQTGSLPELLSETGAAADAARALAEALEGGSFLPFERESERLLLESLQDTSMYTVFGPEPLAAMVLRRELETRHLRLVMAGKSAGIAQERILQRIPRG